MNKKRVKDILTNVFVRMQKPYYQGVAAELAFFFLMSMVPLFIILGEFLGVFSVSLEIITDLLEDYISEDVFIDISQYFVHTPSGTVNIFFILFALWSASKAQYSMIRIANYTFTGLNTGMGFIRERIRAIVSVIITIVLIAFSLVILVYAEPLMMFLGYYVNNVLGAHFSYNQVWYALRWPLGLAIYFFTISFIYYLLPTKKLPYKKMIPGSILTSAGMLISTWIYSYYINRFSNYDLLYGSLATIVGLLIWFYILGFVIVIGIVFNAAIEETR
ncbi:MAG: YihY/virulence factor BrkB family protein [Clostridiales bacterium]|nr:YihY/virulence factor BrkB family protein [Clostridiales bacterium]